MFLVVVDVTKRVGYWVFTQEYERTQLKYLAWKKQAQIQIRLPVEPYPSVDLEKCCVAIR